MNTLINVGAYPVRETLSLLLQDKTTGKNIIWATDTYMSNGTYKDTDAIELCCFGQM